MNKHENILVPAIVRVIVTLLSFSMMVPISLSELNSVLFMTISIFFLSKLLDICSSTYFDYVTNGIYRFLLILDIICSVVGITFGTRFSSLDQEPIMFVILSLLFIVATAFIVCDVYILNTMIKQYQNYLKEIDRIKK